MPSPAAPAAGELIVGLLLLLGQGQAGLVRELGWDTAGFVRKATGREPLNGRDAAHVERVGLQWLTLG
ncbi:hypothetical protein ACWY4P_29100 [Streptomyces sp. LZ34]